MAIVAGPRRLKMLVDNLRVGLQSSLRFLNYPQPAHWRFLRVVDVEPFVF